MEYRQAHLEQLRKKRRLQHEENKEEINALARRKYQEDEKFRTSYLEKVRERNERDRAEIKQRLNDRRTKNKLRAILHLGGKCIMCGFDDLTRLEVLDFHHPNPDDKIAKPTQLLASSWERITEGLSSCVLLCANCHRTETRKTRDYTRNRKPILPASLEQT